MPFGAVLVGWLTEEFGACNEPRGERASVAAAIAAYAVRRLRPTPPDPAPDSSSTADRRTP
ncbi:hypothetical protein [Streptomyces virginiae]|uniref:hypothetical protein n=1 Tax=Streptomyces virginiae TaxID=1961 RepID=UPI0036FE889A